MIWKQIVVILKHKHHIVETNHIIHTQSIEITTSLPDGAYNFVSYYCNYMVMAWMMGRYSKLYLSKQFRIIFSDVTYHLYSNYTTEA